ncbi:MAG: DUF4332 domain-containing protein [Bacteroidales bacterium]|nr:DUF4332 domain-containing protein [Bacteroidales bacterium]
MGYYIDLSTVSIDDYRKKLESAYLPPGRMILKEKLAERFGCLKREGFSNLLELLLALKKKERFTLLANNDCLPEAYLVILLREIKSINPRPNRLDEFPGISGKTLAGLKKAGIKDTRILYDFVRTPQSRRGLSETTGIPEPEVLELTRLTDLSRIKWAGVTFVSMLLGSGYDTLEKVISADSEVLHRQINLINREKSLYKGQIGLNDIKIFIQAAGDVPRDIEY